MGKLSFRYMIKPEPSHMNAFKYDASENSTEYGLAYQRYAALSDASILNSPVGIKKIAAGLSDLGIRNIRELFLTPLHYGQPRLENEFSESKHEFEIRRGKDDAIGINPKADDTNVEDLTEMHRDFHMRILQDTFIDKTEEIKGNKLPVLFIQNSHGNDTNYYQQIHIDGNPNHMIILKDTIADKVIGGNTDVSVRYYDYSWIKQDRIGFSIIENIMTRPQEVDWYLFENIMAWVDDPDMEIIYQWYGNKILHNPIMNDMIFTWRDNPLKGHVFNDELVSKEIHANWFTQYWTKVNKIANWTEGYFARKRNIIANKLVLKICKRPIYTADMNRMLRIDRLYTDEETQQEITTPWLTVFPQLNATPGDKVIYENIFYGVQAEGKTGYFFNIDTFGIQETKYALVIKDIFGKGHNKTIDTPNTVNMGWKGGLNGFIPDFVDTGIKGGINGFMSYETVSGNKDRNNVFTDYYNIIGDKNIKEAFISRQILHAKQGKKKTHDAEAGVHFFKDRIMFMPIQNGLCAYKFPKDLWSGEDSIVSGFKESRDMSILDSLMFQKISKDMDIKDSIVSGVKISHDMYLNLAHYWAEKLPKDMIILKDSDNAWKLEKEIALYKKPLWVHAIRHKDEDGDGGISIDAVDPYNSFYRDPIFAAKKVKNLNLDGMIIPVSRINYYASTHIDETVRQKLKEANELINKNMWASVVPKPVSIDYEEPFFDKAPFQAFIDIQNEWLIKSKIKTAFFNQILFGSKGKKDINMFRNTWISRTPVRATVEPPFSAFKKSKQGFVVEDDKWLKKGFKEVYTFTGEWLDKLPVLGYYSYELFMDRKPKENNISYDMDMASKKEYKGMLNYNSMITKDSNIKIWLADIVFTDRDSKELNIYEHLQWLDRVKKELMLRPEDFGNWAWVYETPDPIGHAYGIDELLLPEEDVKYEQFEDLIFDKEKMQPRNPVKIIDDTTFVAKLPVKHPSKGYYDDIAKDYNASAIKWENYYGIRNEIIRVCFLKYYRIWETKMFHFSTMTMQQAVNKMLEYMYAWMIDYFPLDELEEAFRVLRLIRWYGESAIIQNSQYIISYEYDILESKLTSGKCMIPNDLDANHTMLIDKNLGIIKVNPDCVKKEAAYVEFYIDNKKNTTFTFSLSNTVGSVNIYINDKLVDQKSFSVLNLTYELPSIGDTNVIRIEKPKAHNLNEIFYIGNIKIPNCSFKDLSIEYDPKLKAGNKPIDAVAKKMIQFAQLHENSHEVYEMICEKNLGVNEVYRKLLEYWHLHHENKEKGKRLTIKRL